MEISGNLLNTKDLCDKIEKYKQTIIKCN